MLSINLVSPTHAAAATITGPVTTATGWRSRGSTISRYSSLSRSSVPNAAIAANNLAWIYVATNRDLDQALSLAQTAKRLMPEDPGVNDTLGWIYVKKGMTSLAIPSLERAVKAMPDEPMFNYHLGRAYLDSLELGRARPLLTKAAASPVSFEGIEEAKKALAELH